jgi:hypothetical protein
MPLGASCLGKHAAAAAPHSTARQVGLEALALDAGQALSPRASHPWNAIDPAGPGQRAVEPFSVGAVGDEEGEGGSVEGWSGQMQLQLEGSAWSRPFPLTHRGPPTGDGDGGWEVALRLADAPGRASFRLHRHVEVPPSPLSPPCQPLPAHPCSLVVPREQGGVSTTRGHPRTQRTASSPALSAMLGPLVWSAAYLPCGCGKQLMLPYVFPIPVVTQEQTASLTASSSPLFSIHSGAGSSKCFPRWICSRRCSIRLYPCFRFDQRSTRPCGGWHAC